MTEPERIVNSAKVAAEITEEDARLTPEQRWVREIGFWLGFIVFLLLCWIVAGSFIPLPG